LCNNCYRQVDAVTRRADEQKREADLKLTEFAQLLDIRAQRIKVQFLLFHVLHLLYAYHGNCGCKNCLMFVYVVMLILTFMLTSIFLCRNWKPRCGMWLMELGSTEWSQMTRIR